MIAEYFYTVELKSLINKLKQNGELNEKVLEKINGALRFACFQILFVAGLILFASYVVIVAYGYDEGFFTLIIFFVLFVMLIPSHFHNTEKICNRFAVLVTSGERASGTVKRFWKHFVPNRPNWHCEYSFSEGVIGKCNELPRTMGPYKYSKGDEIIVAYDPNNPKFNIPVTPTLEENYNLRTSSKNSGNQP